MSDEVTADFRQLDIAPVLAKIKKLQRDRGYRDHKGLFFVEGIRNFVSAVDCGFSIDALLYCEKLLISPIARKMVRRLKRAGVPFARVSPEQFRQISQTERASGVGAILRQHAQRLDQTNPHESLCWVALSRIRSLGNLGSLMRTAAAVGAAGFIFIGNGIDPYDPNVVRATMGALFNQRIVRANAEQFRHWIKSHRLQVVGASPDGQSNYDQIGYARPTILLLGNERTGLSKDERLICSHLVRIPMKAGMDSLNVAVAGSLLLYEVFRSSHRQ
jgi:RNA methyltransferase, TrmH family